MNPTRCIGCPFPHGKLVGARGAPASPLVIVGESPGVNEIKTGLPFVGPSGEILNQTLKGYEHLDPFITNAHMCFPGTTASKTPEKVASAVRCCTQRLREEIGSFPHEAILALGNAAMWGLTGEFNSKITQIRGKVFSSQLAAKGIIAAVHPSFLLRGGGSFRQFTADVDYAAALASGKRDYRSYIIPKFEVLSSEQEIISLAKNLDDNYVAADSETGGYEGFDHLRDRILSSGFCMDPNLVYVVPAELTTFTHHLFSTAARFVWHNGKFDAKFFRAGGVPNVRVDEDTMLLSYAADETKGLHDLEQVCSDILGMPDWKYMIKPYLEAARNSHPKGYVVTYADIPLPVLYDYMSRDISGTLQVFPFMREHVRKDKHLEKLYTRVLLPTSEYLVWVEEAGMALDLQQVNDNDNRLQAECDKYRDAINYFGATVGVPDTNPNSPIQLAHLLYDVLKLEPKDNRGRLIKTRSTDEETLDKLPAEHPVVIALKRYRKVKKAHSTYVIPAKDHLDSKRKLVKGWANIDGRVHTTYKIPGTATGRLASENPNLLNIPRDPMLRGQFTCDPDNILLDVDTNQAELRVLAELSQDPELTRIYTTTGLSIHDEVREEIFGDPTNYTSTELEFYLDKFNVRHHGPEKWLSELKAEQKMKAKNVNFGIPYGISEFGLAEQIDDTPAVAKTYLNKWYIKFGGARKFLLQCREAVTLNRVFVTPFGRKRRFGVVSPERLNELQNQASNFPMQSIASDIVLLTGIYMAPIARKLGVRIVNTVYDSILYEVPRDPILIQELSAQTVERLGITAKEWGITRIPIIGDGKVGKRWGQMTEVSKWLKEQREAA
jgi:DNA polymerase-1